MRIGYAKKATINGKILPIILIAELRRRILLLVKVETLYFKLFTI